MATHDQDPTRVNRAPKRKRPRIHHRRELKIATGQAKAEINITPLVDVVLVLLIIFMVITPMLHRGVKIDLPETLHHEKKQDTGEQLVVSVRKDGTWIETERLEGERLMARLRQELKSASRPVHIRADRELDYGDVRKVLEQLHEAGALQVALGTDELKEK
jgi:biopolymer transport protein ExbD